MILASGEILPHTPVIEPVIVLAALTEAYYQDGEN